MFYSFDRLHVHVRLGHCTLSSSLNVCIYLTLPLPCFHFRPYYLQDLVGEAFDENDTLGLLVRETIGGEYYSGPDNYVVNMTVGEIQQWNLQGSEGHPFHMHVNHMQYVNVDGPSLVPGWNQVGDWVDTVSSE